MRRFKAAFILLCLCAGALVVPFSSVAQDVPQLVLPIGHTASVTSVAFSPDGRYALSGSMDTTLKLWEVDTGREVRSYSGHIHGVYSVAFSPNGRYVLSGSGDGALKLWDVTTGRQVRSFIGHTGLVRSLAFSSDGFYALSGSDDKTLKLWIVSSGKEIRTLSGHTDRVNSVAFSPNGRYALSGSNDMTMRLWHIATGKEERSFFVMGHKSPIYSVAFTPDGRCAVASLDGKTLRSWNVSTGREARSFSGRINRVNSVAFSHNGCFIAAGCGDNTLRLWDASTGQKICSFGHKGAVLSVAFSPDDKYILSGSVDRTLKLWDVSIGRETRTFYGHTSGVTLVAFSPDGRYALRSSGDKTFSLWDIYAGREVHAFSGHKGSVKSVAFSPDGKYVVSGSEDMTLKLWNAATGSEVRSFSGHFSGHRGRVNSVAFSPGGHYVLSGSDDKTMKLWDVDTGRNIRTFPGHTKGVLSVAYSPDGRYIASGSSDGTIKLWDASTGRELRGFLGYKGAVLSLAFSSDGKYILSGSGTDSMAKLWDVSTGQELYSMPHNGGVPSVAISPDGHYALSGGLVGRTPTLWSISTGQVIRYFSGHVGYLNSLAFSPDGDYILSGSSDGTTRLWEVTTGKPLFTRFHLGQNDWVVVTPDGRFDGSPDGIQLLHYAKDNKSILLDALFERLYTPRLVAQVLSGGELAPDAPDIRKGIEMPPLVRIRSPKEGEVLRERTLEVVVEAIDQGGGVEDIRLYHNSKWIGGEERGMKLSAQPPEGVQRTFTVSLVNGMNTLRATAFSRDRTEAHPFEIIIEAEVVEATADLYIVAVGINTYKDSNYNLNYCVPDAQAVVACLNKLGSGIFRKIPDPQTIFNEKATRSGIEAALNWVEQDARPEDVFVFYYAGHGVMSEGSKQKPADFHLVPTDVTQLYGNDALLVEKAISATQLRETCQRIKAVKELVILDTCQSGAAVDTFAMRGAAEEKAIAQLARSAGVTVLAAALSEQFAAESKELGHGLFTYTLLQGIEGEADGTPRDGKVTVGELSTYIHDQIEELSKRYHGESQYPKVFMHGQDFPIAIPGKAALRKKNGTLIGRIRRILRF